MGLGIALKSASSTSVQLAVLPLVWPGRTSQACASDTSAMYPSDDTPLSRCPAIPCPSTIPPPSAKGQSDRAESLAVSSMLLCASLQEAIPTTERSSMTTISNSPGIKVDRGPAYDVRARAIILACADAATQNQVVGELRPQLVYLLTLLGKIWFFPVLELSAPCRYTRRRRRKGRMFCP